MTSSYDSDRGLPAAEVILRDGRSLRLRPIRPDDRQRLSDFFYRLSPRTRYLRFHYAKSHLSEEELRRFTENRPPQRCAYVATLGERDQERIVAVGRWEALEDGRSAEVAFTVDDTIQARGIGTALLEQLAEAGVAFGFQRFEATVLPENSAMLGVFDQVGFKTTRRFEEGVYNCFIDLTQREEFDRQQAYREHVARSAGVRHLLHPRSIAVIGASRDARKVGGAIFRNLIHGGFNGVVFPVNPSAPSVGGVLAYPSIMDVPGEVDLAVIAVPADCVLDVVDQCAQKGIWGLLVISAGFGETGGEGGERERRLREKALSYGMRLVGPNCLGIMNTDPELSMNAAFSPTVPPHGRVSMGSESGALGLALLDYAASINMGVSQFVSLGNRIDVSSNDLLEYWEDDSATDVILLYLESFGNPRKFSRIARRVSRSKPIIAVKGGRSVAGARAAASHTGALASAEAVVEALFRQTGIIRVSTIEEMFDAAQVLANQPLPTGNRVAIVTNAGGPGILAADACELWGLEVAPLSEDTQRKLRSFLPREASVGNPVDMIASATPGQYRQAISTVLDDPDVDAVIFIYIPPMVTQPDDIAAAARVAVAAHQGRKPVVACFMMSRGAPKELRLDDGRYIPSFMFPEDAVQALGRAYNYKRFRDTPEGRVPKFDDIDRERARRLVDDAIAINGGDGWMLPEAAAELLRCYGIPSVETVKAASSEEAGQVARSLGFPVVMKLRSRTIVHKTDVGGIVLGLRSEDEVRQAFIQMAARMRQMGRESEMEGVVLQPMLTGGQEVIIGMSHDPAFGPVIMAGLGGIQVEILKDVAFSLHPLTDVDPDRMLDQLRGRPLLSGWRGSSPRDVDALKDALLRFSALIEDFPETDQMEMNPIFVFDQGKGCVAVDARVYLKVAQTFASRRHARHMGAEAQGGSCLPA